LDPLAEGVLVVGVGREATKQLRFVLEEDKEYIGEIKLGMVSETDDEEGIKALTSKVQGTSYKLQNTKNKIQGTSYKLQNTKEKLQDIKSDCGRVASKAEPLECSGSGTRGPAFPSERMFIRAGSERDTSTTFLNSKNNKSQTVNSELITDNRQWPSLEEIKKVIRENFLGDIVQITPTYSAVKIGGERAYKKARRGKKFTRPPRIITIKEIEILDYYLKKFPEIKQKNGTIIPAGEYPVLKVKTIVGSGTYIRSLAREIGEKLNTGGYLISLIRTKIGDYKVEDSLMLDEIK